MGWPVNSSVQSVDVALVIDAPINGFVLPQIQGALDRAYDQAGAQGGAVVTQIEDLVSKIQSYDAQLDSGAANAGLIKADVLEWSHGGVLQGLRDERARLIRRLKLALNLMGENYSRRVLRT